MLSISIAFTIAILGYFAYEVYKRKKFELEIANVINRYSRTKVKIGFNDAFVLFCFLVLAFKGHEYVFIYIPLFTSRIVEIVKLKDEIVLLENGLLFNKTYIEWLKIDKIYNKNKNTLVICSRGLIGKFYIGNISNAEELNFEISKLDKWSNS
jgi:hypothetical protein